MIVDLEGLKDLIVSKLDVLEFLDILELDMSDLVELLEEQIEEAKPQLIRACQ